MSIHYANVARSLGRPATLEFTAGHPVDAVLSGCTELVARGGWQSFTLTFVAAGPAEQGMATVTLPGLEPTAIFLVPVGPADSGYRYEAVFNQPEEG